MTINKPSILRDFHQEIIPTPQELARCFCEMDANAQADFFETVWHETQGWDRPFAFQLQAIIDSSHLTEGGISVMEKLGEYGHASRTQ